MKIYVVGEQVTGSVFLVIANTPEAACVKAGRAFGRSLLEEKLEDVNNKIYRENAHQKKTVEKFKEGNEWIAIENAKHGREVFPYPELPVYEPVPLYTLKTLRESLCFMADGKLEFFEDEVVEIDEITF